MKSKWHVDYFQPSFYRFSEDSILLSKIAVSSMNLKSTCRVIDICCGCGVIGIEILASTIGYEFVMDFCEMQSQFIPFIDKNLRIYEKILSRGGEVFNIDYRNLMQNRPSGHYDYVVANPPYFLPGEGLPAALDERNICRFFLYGGLQDLLETAAFLVRDGGKIFFSCRLSKEKIQTILPFGSKIESCIEFKDVLFFTVSVLKKDRG
ncbi:MAG: hypothetical protein A2504_16165 [Bdellovibrionales bacterium RIFOXYD12_FULL_39_22]|nr:MAG: hypothetical protein A2385_08075 [Bdellovibrionales bacterium RIFOXYB1_FULL_39_21]OFZ42985.1 MAG: hypothetical protein A2485_11150 [Bdellovibrionales bacterium RIFOXYC12_FULL_39_17]OFZ50929.1 MAG: hypothetical protein A2404_06990 [Bdellovibrionales bacterium RIFOXYC1_FULL_39_130]OFZ78152.1 MAG: hypothetical protein A2560_02160 [Bdellovibrionales bacterium RIFOXYD1_FULL_39_84]OFZ94020.1 MAG: hypothetical protein A2504_16165 [Bdellovibrionales bacterium RIFOXYD12_FULL_39_22]HLE10472.1 me